ncbi:MAG: hypothetical protein AAF497_26225, partial [Planctomycetota bacterium]
VRVKVNGNTVTQENIERQRAVQQSIRKFKYTVVLAAIFSSIVLIALFVTSEPVVETNGETTIFRPGHFLKWAPIANALTPAILGFSIVERKGWFMRLFGFGCLLVAAGIYWMEPDISNHHVSVSPKGIVVEFGSQTNPIRQEVSFEGTKAIRVMYKDDEEQIVAVKKAQTVDKEFIKVDDLVRHAIPEILKEAEEQGVLVVPHRLFWTARPKIDRDN